MARLAPRLHIHIRTSVIARSAHKQRHHGNVLGARAALQRLDQMLRYPAEPSTHYTVHLFTSPLPGQCRSWPPVVTGWHFQINMRVCTINHWNLMTTFRVLTHQQHNYKVPGTWQSDSTCICTYLTYSIATRRKFSNRQENLFAFHPYFSRRILFCIFNFLCLSTLSSVYQWHSQEFWLRVLS